ncbi:hypothetical protein ACIHCV_45400 [Streptomyces sp. NPDC051956]|uniref:zinc finger domain-containing protein n=1 Tax=Streptomyces sp. NPDC051956 TaxID=3365677 RepID=UPI0037CF2093
MDLNRPDLCGQPKTKTGEPCGWVITNEPCPIHLTPEEQRRQDERREAEEARRRKAEEDRQIKTGERREGLIAILSVACPHYTCTAPAGSLCRKPNGRPTRPIHLARRQLAGVDGLKEYVVEATNFFTTNVPAPSLDDSPRTVLEDPLEDRTAAARERYAAEQRAAAQHKLDQARRAGWIADAANESRVGSLPCPRCEVAAQERCEKSGGWPRGGFHAERIDTAMDKAGVPRELIQ